MTIALNVKAYIGASAIIRSSHRQSPGLYSCQETPIGSNLQDQPKMPPVAQYIERPASGSKSQFQPGRSIIPRKAEHL